MTSADIVVRRDTQVCVKQYAFLNNRTNKAQLIRLLRKTFEQKHIQCSQSAGDADSLICDVAVPRAHSDQSVVLVGDDTDLLVILTGSVTDDMNISMQTTTWPIYIHAESQSQAVTSHGFQLQLLPPGQE